MCTEPAGTGIGAVCVERGGQTWPKQRLNLDDTHTNRKTPSKAPYPGIRAVMKRLFSSFFFLGKPRKKRLARLVIMKAKNRVSSRADRWLFVHSLSVVKYSYCFAALSAGGGRH